ncbi:MAG: FkbM family methyltransferase [Pseudomonadota bacterium]
MEELPKLCVQANADSPENNIGEDFLKLMKNIIRRALGSPLSKFLVRKSAANLWSRKALNAVYLSLNTKLKTQFHSIFAKIFRDGHYRVEQGLWRVKFRAKDILLPLGSEQIWLEWDVAVSIVGHDTEVKEAYRSLLDSADRPDVFIDVGTNYGTHSLLFLVHGIEAISFEPNSSCHAYFQRLCRVNGVEPNLQHVALGESEGELDLSYPLRDTWLGSTDVKVKNRLADKGELVSERVEQRKLDSYLPQLIGKRALIKIDTEGNEISVLLGAKEVLQRVKPKVIFESWDASGRAALFDFFDLREYEIHSLWVKPDPSKQALAAESFMQSSAQNFIAIPRNA